MALLIIFHYLDFTKGQYQVKIHVLMRLRQIDVYPVLLVTGFLERENRVF